MDKPEIKELEDVAPYVLEHLVPEILESVEACVRSFHDDLYNDSWIFGTHLWKNIWNRFESVSRFEDCPFEIVGKGNEYKLKIGPFVLRHHRIDRESKLPTGAKAVKASATQQMNMFGEEWDPPVEIDNIVLAFDADVESGLREVFVGELKQQNPDTKQYQWGRKVPVYSAEETETSGRSAAESPKRTEFEGHPPEEELPDVSVELDNTRNQQKDRRK